MTGMSKTWVLLVLLATALAALGAAALWLPDGSAGRHVATLMWGLVPTVTAIWQFCYYRVERYRLLVDRWWFRIANRESEWSLTAEFDVDALRVAFDAAVGALDSLSGAVRLADAPGVAVWQLRGTTVRLVGDTAADGVGILRVEFPSAPRQFRSWPAVIGGTVDDVVSAVQDAVPAGRRKFVANVSFPGANPYFGLFVAHAPVAAVRRFDIELVGPALAGADRVLVRNNRIELVTSSLSSVRQLSLRYLALRPLEAP